jgi:V/A-type H+-transporting ATPase subunit E
MNTKLQELTDKIYQEGIAKGNEEAEKIISDAKSEADDIVQKAKKEAEQIKTDAEKKAKEIEESTNAELKLSTRQALNSLKQDTADLITSKIVDDAVDSSVNDNDFMKKIIEITVNNWSQKEGTSDLTILVNENQEKELIEYFKKNAKSLLDAGVEIKAGKQIKAGFQIGPQDGSYKVSFTDEDFNNFFKEYLRPKLVELLFDKE